MTLTTLNKESIPHNTNHWDIEYEATKKCNVQSQRHMVDLPILEIFQWLKQQYTTQSLLAEKNIKWNKIINNKNEFHQNDVLFSPIAITPMVQLA